MLTMVMSLFTLVAFADSNDFYSGTWGSNSSNLTLQYFSGAKSYFGDSLFIGNSFNWNNISNNFNISSVSYSETNLGCHIQVDI